MCITYFLCNKVGVVLLGLWIVFSNTSLVQSTNACFHTTQSIGRTTKEHNNYSKSLSWIENRLWYEWYAQSPRELQETEAAETNHHHHSNLHTSGMYNLKVPGEYPKSPTPATTWSCTFMQGMLQLLNYKGCEPACNEGVRLWLLITACALTSTFIPLLLSAQACTEKQGCRLWLTE